MSRSRSSKTSLDIVTSTFNEEENITELYLRIKAVMEREKSYSWRLLICDNSSQDHTWQIILNLAKKDSRVRGIRLVRNFQLDNSLTCGLDHCDADIAMFIASDLEEPPELIPLFLRSYERGNLHVAGKIVEREGIPLHRRILTKFFYSFMFRLSGGVVQKNVSDFRLVHREIYLAAKSLREKNRVMRGIFAWLGYPISLIDVTRERRKQGKSSLEKSGVLRAIDRSLDWIFVFSRVPLKIATLLGIFLGMIGIASLVLVIFLILFRGVPFAGFGTIVSLFLLGFALNFIFLGILGAYLGLIFEETKSRPIYIVRERTW